MHIIDTTGHRQPQRKGVYHQAQIQTASARVEDSWMSNKFAQVMSILQEKVQ